MATIYSEASWTGSYTYTRVKVDYDYSSTRATATLLYSRTNNYSGATYANGATFKFGDGSTTFSKTFYGKQTDAVVASLTFNYSLSGGTYSGSSTGDFLGGSWSVTIPGSIWNDINAYQPDGSTQNGLIFDLKTSDGGSWTNLTNEPSPFNKASGTTATISNIRTNVTGAHYTKNNVTNTNANSFTWTINTANWVCCLYSAWNTYTIAYNANGGSGAPGNQTKTYGTNLTLSSTKPSRTGYTFLGWSTNQSATSAAYAAGATLSSDLSTTQGATITLYAIWSINSYYLDLNGWLDGASSGGISGYGTADVTIGGTLKGNDVTDYYAQHTYGTSYTISDIKATTGHTYQGVHSGSLSGTIGAGNTSVSLSFTTNKYTIAYNANGGSGAPGNQTKTYGTNLTLSSTKPTRTNYTFLGWSTSNTATSATYSAGATLSSDLSSAQGATVTLYAVWKLNAPSNTTITVNSSTRTKIYVTVGCTGGSITNYTVYYRVNGSSGNYSSLSLGTSTTGIITGLSPNTAYQIYASATNSSGTANSPTTNRTTMANTPKLINTSVSNILPFSTSVSVSATGDTNAPITNYTLYWCKKINKDLKDMSIKYFDNAMWARVFYHQCNEGTTLFTSLSEALSTQTTDKYSRLSLLSDDTFKINGKFEFMLCYPNNNGYSAYNRWKQTNAPQNEYIARSSSGGKVTGYEAVHIDWTDNYWGGLERFQESSSAFNTTYIDGSVGHGNWFYAIGAATNHERGIPSYDSTSSNVELWVRIPDAIVSSKNIGTPTSTIIDGLEEETTYMVWTQATNAGGIQTGKGVIFTTPADQAKIRIKQNGLWQKGKAYYKKDGQWIKAKKIYIKVNGQWKINNNYDS